ncbi:hypothetical protein [Tahibacter soli]|uniref:Secreted protein with PEP-CTERM sorting signal n=1 Tax=Tahibacter soli TaxID=2983605 RepID=A0A9X3YHV2_9GAMM|nr:hypothetical protein [Tahibacter soli]MDC8011093.1 hypothetical protein [Tahibacter soli]
MLRIRQILFLLLLGTGAAYAQNPVLSFDPPAPAALQPFSLLVETLQLDGQYLRISEITVGARRITVVVDQQLIPQAPPAVYRFAVDGLPDGSYTVDVYVHPISVMSPPWLRYYMGSLQLVVGRGFVEAPVPAGNRWTWFALGAGLVALAVGQRRRIAAFAAMRRPL